MKKNEYTNHCECFDTHVWFFVIDSLTKRNPINIRSFFLLIFFQFLILFATSANTIKGRIIDKNTRQAIELANVSIYDSNQKFVNGTTTDVLGTFKFEKLLTINYLLKITHIGYRDTMFQIKSLSIDTDLKDIQLTPQSVNIEEVTVKGKPPVIERKLDKLIVNVSQSVFAEGSTALELLTKAPGVTMDASENLKLNGKEVKIYIDGRPSYLSGTDLANLLKNTDGGSIKSFELMANPSSKYDAEGSGGIIDIKTKKNLILGFNGSVRAGYSAGFYDKIYSNLNGNLTLNFRNEKISSTVMFTPRTENSFGTFDGFQTNETRKRIFYGKTISEVNGRALKAATDFFINKKNTLGFIVGTSLNRGNAHAISPSGDDYYENSLLLAHSNLYNDKNDRFKNNFANLNYTLSFSEKEDLTVNIDYSQYGINKSVDQNNQFFNASGQALKAPQIFNNTSMREMQISSAKIDYQKQLKKGDKLEWGAKYVHTFTDNDLTRDDFANSLWTRNDSLCNLFQYTEGIAAAYFTYAAQFSKQWSAKVGLRAENTLAKGNWISTNITTDQTFFALFPSAYIGYTPGEKHSFTLAYNKRIRRPGFDDLNPFRLYIDAYTYKEGNPTLLPVYTHSFNLGYTLNKYFTISLLNDIMVDMIAQRPVLDMISGIRSTKFVNFGTMTYYGANLSLTELSLIKNIWSFTLNTQVNKSITKGDYVTDNEWNFNTSFNTTIQFPWEIKAELSGWYQSVQRWAYFIDKANYCVSGGLKKFFFDKKLLLTFTVNDIFDILQYGSWYSINGQTWDFDKKSPSQKCGITLTYNFGKTSNTKQRKVGIQEESGRVGAN